jgi:hypothetical protein
MTLNETAHEHARRRFEAGSVGLDVGDDRSEHQASADDWTPFTVKSEGAADKGAGQ